MCLRATLCVIRKKGGMLMACREIRLSPRTALVSAFLSATVTVASCTTAPASSGAASADAAARPGTAALEVGAEAAEQSAAQREARRRARDWLALVDGRRYAESWDSAADIFRAATTRAQWQRSAERARTPLGELTLRQFHAAQYEEQLSGAPEGQYVIIHYVTTFAQKTDVREIVTLMQGPDESWKVAGYFIQ